MDEVLDVQSFTGGLVLEAFLLAFPATRPARAVGMGVVVGALVLLMVRLFTGVSWQWYALIGAAVTFVVGWLLGRLASTHTPGAVS